MEYDYKRDLWYVVCVLGGGGGGEGGSGTATQGPGQGIQVIHIY
jgi:hypothetical protein